jgi:hypothetical protein
MLDAVGLAQVVGGQQVAQLPAPESFDGITQAGNVVFVWVLWGALVALLVLGAGLRSLAERAR